jgi:hypothetical protein
MSGCVALRLALPGGVVTWFVTSFGTAFRTGLSVDQNRIADEPVRLKPTKGSRDHSDSKLAADGLSAPAAAKRVTKLRPGPLLATVTTASRPVRSGTDIIFTVSQRLPAQRCFFNTAGLSSL